MPDDKITIIEDDEQPQAKAKKQSPFSKNMESPTVLGGNDPDDSTKTYLKWGGIAAITIVAVILAVFLGSRAITGYSVYSAMTANGVPEQYVTDMTGLANAKSAAEAQAATATADAAAAQKAKSDAEAAKAASEAQAQVLSDQLKASQAKASELDTKLSATTLALRDSARKLCCVQKAINPAVTSYTIDDDGAVACATDGKGAKISC